MFIIGSIIHVLVSVYILIVILEVGLNWLIALEIVNEKNDAAIRLGDLLKRFTDPVYKHLRKYIPPIGGMDMSPLVLIIAVQIIGSLLASLFFFM